MREQLEKRLEALRAQREQLAEALARGEQQLAGVRANILQHDGAITELSSLLKAEGEAGPEGEAGGGSD